MRIGATLGAGFERDIAEIPLLEFDRAHDAIAIAAAAAEKVLPEIEAMVKGRKTPLI